MATETLSVMFVSEMSRELRGARLFSFTPPVQRHDQLDRPLVVSRERVPMIMIFETDTGMEVPAITTDQMREVDRIAVEETGPNLYQMMENAGRNLAALALELLGDSWNQARIVALAGSGGNGGGAICAARHLANRDLNVRLCLSSPDRLGEVPTWQRCIYQGSGGIVVTLDQLDQEPADLILDGIIGYSLRSAPQELAAELIEWANAQAAAQILSLDVPSGVDSTTGETPGVYVHAHTTMTLALPKTGLIPEKTGKLMLADLGIPKETYRRVKGIAYTSPFGNRYRVPLHPKLRNQAG